MRGRGGGRGVEGCGVEVVDPWGGGSLREKVENGK